MAPNQSLTMDVSSFGDALHRDLYVRDTYQTSSNAILNEYFHLQGTTATAIAAKQVQISGTEGSIFNIFDGQANKYSGKTSRVADMPRI